MIKRKGRKLLVFFQQHNDTHVIINNIWTRCKVAVVALLLLLHWVVVLPVATSKTFISHLYTNVCVYNISSSLSTNTISTREIKKIGRETGAGKRKLKDRENDDDHDDMTRFLHYQPCSRRLREQWWKYFCFFIFIIFTSQ